MLESTLFSADDRHLIPPSNIFNVDESGYTIVQKSHKIVAQKGRKNVGQMTSGERCKNITVVYLLLACMFRPCLYFREKK